MRISNLFFPLLRGKLPPSVFSAAVWEAPPICCWHVNMSIPYSPSVVSSGFEAKGCYKHNSGIGLWGKLGHVRKAFSHEVTTANRVKHTGRMMSETCFVDTEPRTSFDMLQTTCGENAICRIHDLRSGTYDFLTVLLGNLCGDIQLKHLRHLTFRRPHPSLFSVSWGLVGTVRLVRLEPSIFPPGLFRFLEASALGLVEPRPRRPRASLANRHVSFCLTEHYGVQFFFLFVCVFYIAR